MASRYDPIPIELRPPPDEYYLKKNKKKGESRFIMKRAFFIIAFTILFWKVLGWVSTSDIFKPKEIKPILGFEIESIIYYGCSGVLFLLFYIFTFNFEDYLEEQKGKSAFNPMFWIMFFKGFLD